MKVAIVLAAPWIPGSVDMTAYLRGLRDLGHEAMLICQDRSQGPAGYNAIAADQNSLQNHAFYASLGLDAAITFTWFNSPGMISAMKSAGMKVLIRGDSDGLLSIRQFPAHHYRVRMSAARGPWNSIVATKHFLHRYLLEYRGEDRDRLASIAAADVSVLETAEAARHVEAFLNWQHRADLISRLAVVPHLVADEFLNCEVNRSRNESIVAIGRWEDPQKNAPLLARTIQLHLATHLSTKVYIIGGEGGRSAFDQLTAKNPQVIYTGPQNSAGVRRYLTDARVLLSASRWEGSPVVANEALAMGATVVGTPIPAFVDICQRGFGTVSTAHSAQSLAGALEREWKEWEHNNRKPESIARHWRPLLSAEVVVSALCRLLLGEPVKPSVETRMPLTV